MRYYVSIIRYVINVIRRIVVRKKSSVGGCGNVSMIVGTYHAWPQWFRFYRSDQQRSEGKRRHVDLEKKKKKKKRKERKKEKKKKKKEKKL